jgi:hypothetical protein
MGGVVGLRAGLKFLEKGKNNVLPLPELELRTVEPVTSHYTNGSTPASVTFHSKIKWASFCLSLHRAS